MITPLTRLYLLHNLIGDVGAVALATALVAANHVSLVFLGLSRNEIGDGGTMALAIALVSMNHNSLEYLDLRHNNIKDKEQRHW
mmetsp:Transcript_2543/g.5794  ORF Transcript_2543/g.5794 Transcript_2543/m.5794 type:complete len:84 (+) Transcript_2543:782-1033(+)